MSGYDLILAKNLRMLSMFHLYYGRSRKSNDMKNLFNTCGVVGAIAGSLFVFKGTLKAVLINYPHGMKKMIW